MQQEKSKTNHCQYPDQGDTVRFTVDMPLSLHQELSELATKQRKKKAELVRFAIARLLKDMHDGTEVQ